MHSLFVHIPKWFQKLFSEVTWSIDTEKKELFLTFDDGPTPEITDWVLDQLAMYNAKATFFCIGKNIQAHPELFEKIIAAGHHIGNHTFNHLNGWKVSAQNYLNSIEKTQRLITTYKLPNKTPIFRPPYGKISPFQIRKLNRLNYQIVLWNVLSGDFDKKILPKTCTKNVLNYSGKGSIIVFHDSLKAAKNMKASLPKVLAHFSQKGYTFSGIL